MYVHTISYGTACMCGIYLYPASLTLFFWDDVGPHLEQKRYNFGAALSGCKVQCRPPILQ